LVLPSTKIRDVPTFYGTFSPFNADEKFRGVVTAKQALIHSLNVPAVRLLNTYGQADFYEFLKLMGLKNLFRSADDYGLPLILGGAEVNLFEMAQLYRGLALGGHFDNISFINDKNHTVQPSQKVFSDGAAFLTVQMLKDLNRPGSEFYWNQYQSSYPLAWKTGTSYGQRDGWAIGVNPQWVIAVWVGNFTGEGNPELSGAKSAGPLLFDLFNLLPKDRNKQWFEKPETDLSYINLCKWSGFVASENCPEILETDKPVNMRPMKLCPWHRPLFVNDKNQTVCSLCWEDNSYNKRNYLLLPPDINQYLRDQGFIFNEIPQHNPTCTAERNEKSIEIIYPTPNARLWIPRDYDGQYQKVTVRAAHQRENVKIFWYLDDYFVGETTDKHSMALSLSDGKHSLVIVDETGLKSQCIFYSGKSTE
jgi:penicillin-binding protein 1C